MTKISILFNIFKISEFILLSVLFLGSIFWSNDGLPFFFFALAMIITSVLSIHYLNMHYRIAVEIFRTFKILTATVFTCDFLNLMSYTFDSNYRYICFIVTTIIKTGWTIYLMKKPLPTEEMPFLPPGSIIVKRIPTFVIPNRRKDGKVALAEARKKAFDLSESIQKMLKTQEKELKEPGKSIDSNNNEINTFEILQSDEKKPEFPLAVLAQALGAEGTKCIIQQKSNNNLHLETSSKCFECLAGGLETQKQTVIRFNLGEKTNNEILNNKDKLQKFTDTWKQKISEETKIPNENIEVVSVTRGSIQVSFLRTDNPDKSIFDEDKAKSFKEKNKSIVEISTHPLLSACMITADSLDPSGNKEPDQWSHVPQKRGGEAYNPPHGWMAFGIKVKGRYPDGNNWYANDGNEREFPVAYHGLRNKPKDTLHNIVEGRQELIPGNNQYHENSDDFRHPGEKCGRGCYLTPDINVASEYTSLVEVEKDGKKCWYRLALMCRVNPKNIRQSALIRNYWILNPEDIRPYRLLMQKVKEEVVQNDYKGVQVVARSLNTKDALNKKLVDVLFLCDCTGSMAPFIKSAKIAAVRIARNLWNRFQQLSIHIGFIAYRDHRDSVMLEQAQLTTDRKQVFNFVKGLKADGGNDCPEAVADALNLAVKSTSWRDNSLKLLIHILDAPPHGREYYTGGDNYPNGCPCGFNCINLVQKLNALGTRYILMSFGNDVDTMARLFGRHHNNLTQLKLEYVNIGKKELEQLKRDYEEIGERFEDDVNNGNIAASQRMIIEADKIAMKLVENFVK